MSFDSRMPPNKAGVCGRYGLVQFALRHPVYAHGLPSRSNGTISPSGHLHKIVSFIRLAKVCLAPIMRVYFGVYAVPRRMHRKVGLKQPMA